MADSIRVDPANLRYAADRHNEAADYLRTVPAGHEAIQESLDSLGPIFGELREAARELLEQRLACYQQQADDHAGMAAGLASAADRWEAHEDERAAALRALGDEGT
jgi:Excreted virulence factor EspC, type VII ESX diderm